MKKYLIPILFTVVIIALLIFAVRASMSENNDVKPSSSPTTKTLNDKQKEELKQGQSRGASDAKVVLSEFADFQCPACKSFEPTLTEILAENEGKVRLVFKHFPLYPSPHKNAMVSAYAAESAAKQGKFWEMHDKLYANQDDWAELGDPKDKFIEYARELGLNTDDFSRDLNAETGKDTIKRDKDFGLELGIQGTPTIFIDGVEFNMRSDGGAEGLKGKIKQAVEAAYGTGQ
ncbi:thioredoxin domain-containing protein [bacterium]|nr:MAG: thioredoxin domain-containing protein [bacterium]